MSVKEVLILGADTIGESLATQLISENLSITVIDSSRDLLNRLQDKLDIQVVYGIPSQPEVLEKANAMHVDIIIAVTTSDEVNITACLLAQAVFSIPKKIACIRGKNYFSNEVSRNTLMKFIDQIIHPAELVTNHIKELFDLPGANDIFNFADERVQMVAVKAFYGGLLVNRALRGIREDIPEHINTRIVAIFRNGQSIHLTGDTIVHPEDEVFFCSI